MAIQTPVSVNSNLVRVRATLTYTLGTSQATLRIYDVRITTGGAASNFTTTDLGYAYTEYDATRDLMSPLSAVTSNVDMSSQNVVTLGLPSTAKNTITTHWVIFRRPPGTSTEQLGQIGMVPVSQTSYVDTFDDENVAYDQQPLPLAPMLGLVSGGVTTYFPRDTPPPRLEFITSFKGALVGLAGRGLYSSIAGRPESWAEIGTIKKFFFDTRDELVAAVGLQDVLVVGSVESIFVMDDVVRAESGQLVLPEVRPISGQPGCVGRHAMVSYSVAGESLVAWVSPFGVHITNGRTAKRISDDLDWLSEVSVSDLSTAVLHWDQHRMMLIFAYDSSGGGANDRFLLFHMAPEHIKENGLPKVTGPHYGKFDSIASGMVGGVYKVYTSEAGDGEIYLEWSGTTDISQSYSSTQVPMILKTPLLYAEWDEFAIDRGNLRHTDAGTGQTVSVLVETYRDPSGSSQSVTKTVSVAGDKGTEFFVGRAGESAEITVTHTGAATFSIQDMRLELEKFSGAGTIQ